MVWFDDPEEIKAIFRAPADVLHCGNGSLDLEHFFGRRGLAYMEEDEHLARRRVVNRSTHGDELKRINAAMRKIAERDVSSWPSNEPIDVWPLAHRLTISALFQVCFGPHRDERIDELFDVVERMMAFNDSPLSLLPMQHARPVVLRALATLPPVRRFLELRARADELIYDLIAEGRRTGETGGSMLGILLAATEEDGSPLPAVEIRDEIMTAFLAGTVTTAAGISWGVEQLAREHSVRERLVAEIDAGEDESYLSATVCEILRRNPPLTGVIPRTVMKPFELNGHTYEPGTRLVPTPYLLHHNPAVYADPYAFRPERFLDDPPRPDTWIPFGGGRRRCLGKAIAENEIKYVLQELLTRYELHPETASPPVGVSHIVALRPASNPRVTLSERSARRIPVAAA